MLVILWFVITVCLFLYGLGMIPWIKPFNTTVKSATICLACAMLFIHMVLNICNRKKRKEYGYYSIGGARGSW